MGPKTKSNFDQGFPGPGTYEGEGMIGKTSPHPNDPKWGFSKNPRDQKYGNANPGPGQYDSPDRKRIEGGYIGHRPGDMSKSHVPGPGAYDGNSANWKQSKAPAYSMRQKTAGGRKDAVPGPGHYDPDAIRYEHKSYSGKLVSKAARDHMYKTGTPGPGNYDPNNNIFSKQQGKFGRESRDGLKGSANPGPGAYEMRSSFEKKGYSYGKQPRDWQTGSAIPGPGTYDYNASSMGGPGWKIGKEARDGWKTTANPGPGNYDIGGKCFDKKSGKINPEARTGSNFNNPGPGTYDGDYTVGRTKNPQFSFGKGDKVVNDQGFPGPGTYDGHGVDTRASVAMDKGDKGLKYGNPFPGPGTYDYEHGLGSHPKYSFGKDPRDKDADRLKVGPADYDIPHSIPDVAGYNYPSRNQRKIHL